MWRGWKGSIQLQGKEQKLFKPALNLHCTEGKLTCIRVTHQLVWVDVRYRMAKMPSVLPCLLSLPLSCLPPVRRPQLFQSGPSHPNAHWFPKVAQPAVSTYVHPPSHTNPTVSQPSAPSHFPNRQFGQSPVYQGTW